MGPRSIHGAGVTRFVTHEGGKRPTTGGSLTSEHALSLSSSLNYSAGERSQWHPIRFMFSTTSTSSRKS